MRRMQVSRRALAQKLPLAVTRGLVLAPVLASALFARKRAPFRRKNSIAARRST